MVGAEIDKFIAASFEGYVAQRVASGEDLAVATSAADEQMAVMFPEGGPGPGHLLYRLEEEGRAVGSLWIGPAAPTQPRSYWVWDILIEEAHRGRGLGRAAMLLAEGQARSAGAVELGLTVFGDNIVARRLYERLEYTTVALRMSKRL